MDDAEHALMISMFSLLYASHLALAKTLVEKGLLAADEFRAFRYVEFHQEGAERHVSRMIADCYARFAASRGIEIDASKW